MTSRRSLTVQLALLFLVVTMGLGSADCWAQEAATDPQPTAVAGDTTPAAKPKPPAVPWEKLIYIPYRNLANSFNQPNATIFMPLKEFEALWKSASGTATSTAAVPVPAVITSAQYTGTIENNLARITAEFKVRVLDKPWTQIPLQFGDAAIGKLTASHEQTALIGTGDGTYSLLLPTVGEHTVTLELVTRVRTATEGRNFQLLVPPVGITNFELTIPAPDQTVEVLPHLVSSPAEAGANATRITSSVGSTNQLTVRWYPRVSKTPEMELLTSVTNQIHARVADGLIQTEAVLNYQILRGEFHQAVIAVPVDHRILDVEAPNLKGWKAAKEAQRQVLTIDLLASAGETLPITVRTEHPATGETLNLAGISEDGQVFGIHAIGAVRESGVLVVSHASDLALAVEQQRGLSRTEASEVPEPLRRDSNLYFKYFTPNFRMSVAAKAVEPRLTATHQASVTFRDDELRVQSHFKYTVERAGVFELRWNLPENLKVQRVDCAQKREYAVTPDGKTLILTLQQKTQGEITVEIHTTQTWDSKTESELVLPLLEPQGTAREDGQLYVLAPQAYEIVTDEQALVGMQPDQRQDDRANFVQRSLDEGLLRLVSTWTFNRRPATLPVNVTRRPTRLTAQLTTTVNVARETLETQSRAIYNVEYAGVDQFRIDVPAELANAIQIEAQINAGSVPIKDQKKSAPQNGWVTITITTQREVLGQQIFLIKSDTKLEKQDKTASVVLQPIRLGGVPGGEMGADKIPLTSFFSEISVSKDRLWSLAATPKDLQTIDVRELTLLPQEGALAYRYSRQPAELALSATEHEIQEVVQTVVSRMLVEAVVTHEDTVTYRCRFLLQTSERQRLALDLPAQVQPLGVLVAGKQVNLERNPEGGSTTGSEGYFMNVTRTGKSEEPFPITLVYRIPGKGLSNSALSGQLALHLPQLGGTSGSVAVQQLQTIVWVPQHITLVGTPVRFTPQIEVGFLDSLFGRTAAQSDTLTLESWIGAGPTGLFEFPTAGHAFVYNNLGGAPELKVSWWRTTWVIWVWTAALLVVGWILRKTTWENRLGALLLAIVGLLLLALSDPGYAVYLAHVSRYGLLALGLLWVLVALLTQAPQWQSALVGATAGSGTPRTNGLAVPYAVIPPPGVFERYHTGDSGQSSRSP